MIDLETAVQAQDKLGMRIGGEPWLQGIAVIADDAGSHYLRVSVPMVTEDVVRVLPHTVEGVPIVVRPIGRLRSL